MSCAHPYCGWGGRVCICLQTKPAELFFGSENDGMPSQPNEPKRPPGRPEVLPEDRLQVVSIRLTEAQKAKLEQLGGSAWLRRKIDAARVR